MLTQNDIQKNFKIILLTTYISVFTWVPHLVMTIYAQNHNLIYTGIYGYGSDTPAYLEQMIPEASKGLLHVNFFTNEPHKPVLINTFYVIFGKLFSLLNIPLPFGLLLLRIIFGSLLLFIFYKTILSITKSSKIASYSLYFLMFGGGLAQLVLIKITSSVASHFETLPGVRIFSFPHSVLAVSLIWLIVYYLTKFDFVDIKKTLRLSILIGLLTCVITLLVPFYFLIIISALVLFFLREIIVEKKIAQICFGAIIILILSCPYLLYLYLIVLKDPVWANKFSQAGDISSTSVLMLIVAFCLYILFILFDLNIKNIFRERFKYLLWSWLIVASILSILGLPGGWRYIEGISLPLSVLSSWGLINLLKTKYFYAKILIIFLALLFVLLIIAQAASVHFINSFQGKFISKDLFSAYNWIKTNSRDDIVIVSNSNSVIYAPYYARRKVFVGHWAESFHADERFQEVQKMFMNGNISKPIKQLINNYKVCFIVNNIKIDQIPIELNSNQYYSTDFGHLRLICENEAIQPHENK